MSQQLKLTLFRSVIGRNPTQRNCIKGLGFTGKMNQSVIVDKTASILGMIRKVDFMLKIEEVA